MLTRRLTAWEPSYLRITSCSSLSYCCGRAVGSRVPRRHRLRAQHAQQPFPNTPSGAPQDELFRQTTLRTVWSTRLSAAAVALGQLLRSGVSFLVSCRDVLPHFTVLSPQAALQRMILILAASLLMVVLLTTIDSALLYTYVRGVRRLA